MKILDRKFYFKQLHRAQKRLYKHDFIHKKVSGYIYDHLKILNQKFDRVLVFGYLSCNLNKFANYIEQYQYTDYDEEHLPNFNDKFDLIISTLSLHYINDLPGTLVQYHKLLNNKGVLIGAFFGEQTLQELRAALQDAEIKLFSGISPRVIPMISVKDAAGLMQRTGFKNSVSEVNNIEVQYKNIKNLFSDIKGMGQSNALLARNTSNPGKEFFIETEKFYKQKFSKDDNIVATFDIIIVTGSI